MAARKRSGPPIHAEIKRRLGYPEDMSDREVYTDWNERKSRVCKPCWELKYCPYGPLVEESPILPSLREGSWEHNEYFRKCLETGLVGTVEPLSAERREFLEEWVADEDIILRQALHRLQDQKRLAAAEAFESDDEKAAAFAGLDGLPPIHEYRVPFDQSVKDIEESDFPADIWDEILSEAQVVLKEHQTALESGLDDNRKPLEPARRAWFQQVVDRYDPEDHPESIPQTFEEASCNVFGHICPVFFAAENITETSEARRMGRTSMPFEMMMRIVRRDDYRCQHCKKKLRDDEVEFDHKIPVSRGGSSEEHNMRLTCYACNKDKGDDFEP